MAKLKRILGTVIYGSLKIEFFSFILLNEVISCLILSLGQMPVFSNLQLHFHLSHRLV